MIPVIKIGNDFNLRLIVRRGDGTAEDFDGVEKIEVQAVKNGAAWVTVLPNSYYYGIDGIVVAKFVADNTQKEGEYRVKVKYTKNGRRYLAENCQAFLLTTCCYQLSTDTAESIDVTLDVQFSSDGKDGLSAYELAVANGEYTGDYAGYQQWLAGGAGQNEWAQLSINIEAMGIGGDEYSSNSTQNVLVLRAVGYVQNPEECEYRFMRRLKRRNVATLGRNTRHGWGVMREGYYSTSKIAYSIPLYTLERTVINNPADEFLFGISDTDEHGEYTKYRTGYAKSSTRKVRPGESCRIDIDNYGFALFRGDKMISNIAEFGVTAIHNDAGIHAYYTLGRRGAKINIRKLIKFNI